MIKEIIKIDIQGREIHQEVVVCNRCKKVLFPTDMQYQYKLVAAHPVRITPGHAYGIAAPNDPYDICENCRPIVIDILTGKDLDDKKINSLSEKSTPELLQIRNSVMCGVWTADEIDKILAERGLN